MFILKHKQKSLHFIVFCDYIYRLTVQVSAKTPAREASELVFVPDASLELCVSLVGCFLVVIGDLDTKS